MKKLLVCLVVAMMAVAVQAQTGGVEKTVAGMEQQWATASKASNPDLIAPMLAKNFVGLNSDGTTADRSKVLDNTKKSKWQTNEISDVKVSVSGDTAIATGAWRGKGTDQDGKSIDAHERWVDTWTKMPDGKWQCIASASAPVKM